MVAPFRELEMAGSVGQGEPAFAAVRDALLTWRLHRAAGVDVLRAPERVEAGGRAVLRLRLGPLAFDGGVLVTAVTDAPAIAGFRYEALPGHPEEGWSEFRVERGHDDAVSFTVHSSSRPGRWWSRLGAPVSRAVQRRATARYVEAARAAAHAAQS